jgi:hypothetical protein
LSWNISFPFFIVKSTGAYSLLNRIYRDTSEIDPFYAYETKYP